MTDAVAPPDRADRWPLVVAIVATALALGLDLWDLGHKSLWYDEAFTVGTVDRPLGDVLWRITHWEVNQSPYLLLMAGWSRLGHDEAFLRLLSVVPAVASVPALYLLGRRLVDRRVAAVAALLLAVHPLALQWAQQLRAYSLVLLLVLVATILLLRAVERPGSVGRAVLYGVVAAAATYTQFFAGLVVVAHLAWALLLRPLPRRTLLVGLATAGVLVLPLVWYTLTFEGDPVAWAGGGRGLPLADTAKGVAGGRLRNVAVYGLAAAGGLAATAWALRRPAPSRPVLAGPADRAWGPVLPALWLLAVPAGALVLSVATQPLLEARFLIVVLPALALVAATAVCRAPWRPLGAAILVALLLVSLDGSRRWHDAEDYEDWRGAVAVAAAAGPEASWVLDPPLGVFAVRYYEERLDLGRHEVIRPGLWDPPAGPVLVEIRRTSGGSRRTELHEIYDSWRDEHYTGRREQHVPGLVVVTYHRRP